MRQGIPHLGTKGNTSHPDCALFLLAYCPGRGSSLPMSGSEVEVFWAPTDVSIGSAGSTLSSPVVSVFIVRTSVKHLSTGPCMGLSSRVVVTGFFCLMAAWLNEGRCPGGRPSVSTNYITIEASVFCIEMTTVHAIYEHRIKLAVSQRVPFG